MANSAGPNVGPVLGLNGHWMLAGRAAATTRIAAAHQFKREKAVGGKSERQLLENRYPHFVP